MFSICCRLIIILSIYVRLTLTLAKVCPHFRLITSSSCKWSLHNIVNKETKKFNLTPIFSCKSSWDFSRKNECNNILNSWKMHFQALDDKGQHFLELLDDDSKPIELLISKGGTWLKYFGHSNSLCTRATRVIINHAPIGEYCLRFFPWEKSMWSISHWIKVAHSSWV